MTKHVDLENALETLRERFSTLSSAILHINSTLDLTIVLQKVVDGARVFTGARYGIITTIDEAGQVQDYVSSGFTAEEHAKFAAWPDGLKPWSDFRDLPGPIRLTDLPVFVRSLGYSPTRIRSKTFQGIPLQHLDVQVGNLFLAEKVSAPEFTDEDEELLVLFASLAATAIANARTYRDEQRNRADLEALVETSPVGVVVLNAKAGHPVSFNLEARRIVENLRTPGRPLEELAKTVTCRRADGREIALSDLPLARQLSSG